MDKVAFEDPDRPGFYSVDGRTVTKDELDAIKKVFPGDWLTIEWEDPPFERTKQILHGKNQNDIENGNTNID